ncbi:hypothetical protein EVAR_45036_1 [Eumeta japonica]|uniref:Uncharacterized protein n=1 Tax=Eumeta variegata TaxID=151549 RepID=A0A4C1YL71_EUMVA|nr:hypothetical protein EVAR_45036_1 [Eumeta japonica]
MNTPSEDLHVDIDSDYDFDIKDNNSIASFNNLSSYVIHHLSFSAWTALSSRARPACASRWQINIAIAIRPHPPSHTSDTDSERRWMRSKCADECPHPSAFPCIHPPPHLGRSCGETPGRVFLISFSLQEPRDSRGSALCYEPACNETAK